VRSAGVRCVWWRAAAVLWLAAGVGQAAGRPTKSWLYVDRSCHRRVLVEGERWEVPVEYCLDAADDDGGTSVAVWIAGPWIDCPDGQYTKKRFHVGYPGMSRSAKVQAGRGRHVFTFTVPPAKPRNELQVICNFRDRAGKAWPWHVRCGNIWFRRKGGFFELETDKPGNLFTYGEPVRVVARLRNVAEPGRDRDLAYKVYDVTRATVAEGRVSFRAERDGQTVPIVLTLRRRGTFLIEATVDGWEARHTTFCRIPDVMALTEGKPTRFGLTNVASPAAPARVEELCRIGRRLGLTWCRNFVSWYAMEPGPGDYRLEPFEQALDIAHRHGIRTWYCIVKPPAWALRGEPRTVGYRAFECDWEAWRDFVRTATARLKGKLYGWEWLNEIVPGGTDAPVDHYLALCRIGTETARAVDPRLKFLLAGGLWPRSFRTAVLAAGVGQYVDVLPIHYSNGDGVREAREDLETAGCEAAVWDNESGRGVSTWGAPPLDDLGQTVQSNWVLTQWVDELAAGCETIIYFGGQGSAAGNWTYLFDDHSPRPLAATLAVLTSKLFQAKPLGAFTLGKGGLFHLFDRQGKAVLVASSSEPREALALHVGSGRVRVTDYQGNERMAPAADGVASLALAPLRCFVEGADLDVLKAYVVPSIVVHRAGRKRSKLGDVPHTALLAGERGEIRVSIQNLFDRELAGTLRAVLPSGWGEAPRGRFSVAPGQRATVPLAVSVPRGADLKDYAIDVRCDFAWAKLPPVSKPLVASVLDPAMLGNLFPNGGLETPDPSGRGPDGWRVNGRTVQWASSEGLGDGLGTRVLKFANTGDRWGSCGRTFKLRGGLTYLYTAWVRNRDMHAGSNIYQHMADGSRKPLYDVQVFTCGSDNAHWQVFTCRYKAPASVVEAGFVPVVKGRGHALFDNLRVTVYEGTDFAAECHRVAAPPTIDGKLDDWARRCPIPLLGRNQLAARDPAYRGSPDNLSGVAWLAWDDASLYLALAVRDDQHVVKTSPVTDGDSVILAVHPQNRLPGTDAKAFAWHISAARPGGGSGAHTILRPRERSGGLRHGHLFRDSSVYEMAVATEPGRCTYELRIPFGELGGVRAAVGSKIGLSLQLNDNDGRGPAAHIHWGGGLSPAWRPASFGVVTLVDQRSTK